MFIARRRFIPVSQNKSALSFLSSVPFHITHTFLSFPSIINHYLHPIITHTHTHTSTSTLSPDLISILYEHLPPRTHTHSTSSKSFLSIVSSSTHALHDCLSLTSPPHTLRKNSQFQNVTCNCSSRSYPHPHTPTLSFSKSFFSIVAPPEESRHS